MFSDGDQSSSEREYPLVLDGLQNPELQDSTRLYKMDEIIVSAIRLHPTMLESPSAVSLIERTDIECGAGSSLANALTGLEGVFLKDYGSSALKTISQRGFGAEHTLFLVNGFRITSFQNGLLDLGLFPVSEIEKIEVVHGGLSAAFGPDAVAGVINIVSKAPEQGGKVAVESSLGSFGYQRYRVGAGLGSTQAGMRVGLQNERSSDNFEFVFANGPVEQMLSRRNSDFSSRYASLETYVMVGEMSRLSSFAQSYSSERGVGGPVVSAGSLSLARQTDGDHLAQARVNTELSGIMRFTAGVQTHYTYQRYLDSALKIGGSEGIDSYFKNIDHRLYASVSGEPSDDLKLDAGVEFARTTAEGNAVQATVERWQAGTYAALQYVLVRHRSVLDHLSWFPSLRLDAFNSSPPSLSPHMAVVAVFEETHFGSVRRIRPALRGSISRNFRLPTFNELYYAGGGGFGNPRLRPEHSSTLEGGGTLLLDWNGRHAAQLSFFHNEMKDRIVWIPAGFLSVAPKNIRTVESHGFEGSYQWDPFAGALVFDAAYTFVRSVKRSSDYPGDPNINTVLVYVPERSATVSATWRLDFETHPLTQIGGRFSHLFVGSRYTSEDNSSVLPSYGIATVTLFARWGLSLLSIDTKLEIHNLFDESYQVILGYPMPLQSFRLSLGVRY